MIHFDIASLENDLKQLESQTINENFWLDTKNSSTVLKKISVIKAKLEKYNKIKADFENLKDLSELLKIELDEEMAKDLIKATNKIEKEIMNLEINTLLSGKYDINNAIITLHPGAGGTESQDWVQMLYRMYTRWAQDNGYAVKELDFLDGDEAGIKSVTALISGEYAYGYLKGEMGVHRLVRISPFDSGGRRHTSFASVEVLPEITDDIEIQINPDGTYTLDLEPGEYDIVISKTSYLEHRVTNIVVKDGKIITIDDINIYAGDLDENGEIEIEDLTSIIENYGTITDDNKAQKEKYDLNEDGIVNKQDRSILKANYGKTKTTEKWVDPNPPAQKVTRTRKATKQENTVSSQNFVEPLKSQYTITSAYGTRVHPTTGEVKKHTGIDLAGTHHAEVVSVADGEVTYAGVQKGFGNSVEIKHIVNGETIYSFYAHLSRIDVQKGQKVKQSQTIGLEGGDPQTDQNVGNSTGHHLHFELRKASGYGNDIDPTSVFGAGAKKH